MLFMVFFPANTPPTSLETPQSPLDDHSDAPDYKSGESSGSAPGRVSDGSRARRAAAPAGTRLAGRRTNSRRARAGRRPKTSRCAIYVRRLRLKTSCARGYSHSPSPQKFLFLH